MKFFIDTKISKDGLLEIMAKAKVKLKSSNLKIGWAEDDGYSFEALMRDEEFDKKREII
ncbi:MAG: hypothetical protein ACI8XX_001919 [Polaribacter sp.]|jgi:hypothetical protein